MRISCLYFSPGNGECLWECDCEISSITQIIPGERIEMPIGFGRVLGGECDSEGNIIYVHVLMSDTIH